MMPSILVLQQVQKGSASSGDRQAARRCRHARRCACAAVTYVVLRAGVSVKLTDRRIKGSNKGVHGGAPELQSNPRAHIAHRSGCTPSSRRSRGSCMEHKIEHDGFGRAGRRWRVRRASQRQWAAACVHALQCGARRCRAVALSMSASEHCPCACRMPMLSGHFFASLLLLMWYQYGQNTSPTVYITAIQMVPSGERFFRSS